MHIEFVNESDGKPLAIKFGGKLTKADYGVLFTRVRTTRRPNKTLQGPGKGAGIYRSPGMPIQRLLL